MMFKSFFIIIVYILKSRYSLSAFFILFFNLTRIALGGNLPYNSSYDKFTFGENKFERIFALR